MGPYDMKGVIWPLYYPKRERAHRTGPPRYLQQTKDLNVDGEEFGASVSLSCSSRGTHSEYYSVTRHLQATSPDSSSTFAVISSSFEPHMGVYVQHQDKWVHLATLWSPCVLIRVPEQSPDLLAPHRGSKARASLDMNSTLG